MPWPAHPLQQRQSDSRCQAFVCVSAGAAKAAAADAAAGAAEAPLCSATASSRGTSKQMQSAWAGVSGEGTEGTDSSANHLCIAHATQAAKRVLREEAAVQLHTLPTYGLGELLWLEHCGAQQELYILRGNLVVLAPGLPKPRMTATDAHSLK